MSNAFNATEIIACTRKGAPCICLQAHLQVPFAIRLCGFGPFSEFSLLATLRSPTPAGAGADKNMALERALEGLLSLSPSGQRQMGFA